MRTTDFHRFPVIRSGFQIWDRYGDPKVSQCCNLILYHWPHRTYIDRQGRHLALPDRDPLAMSAAPKTEDVEQRRMRLQRAAIAATLAAKQFGKSANVAAVAADWAFKQGASPGEAANIALSLQKQAEEAGGGSELTDESWVAAVKEAMDEADDGSTIASNVVTTQVGSPGGSVRAGQQESSAPPVDPLKVFRYLSTLPVNEWRSESEALSVLGLADPLSLDPVLEPLVRESFLFRRSGFLLVTETGGRYLQYSAQSANS